MSHAHPTASSSSNQVSNFQLIINNALDEYKKRTKKDLRAHPLVTELQFCNTPSAILSVLQQQVQGLDESRRSDDRWTRWLDPTVNVLFTFSATLGGGVGMVFSPAKVIFAGFGVLLSAAKDARASQNTLIDIFERIEMFFRRLEVYTQVSPTTEMKDILIQIMVEVLSILGIATKEIKQGRLKKYAMKLIGRTKIEDALKRLDKLTQEEARMASAQNLKITHTVDERVRGVVDTVVAIDNRVVTVDDKVTQVIADGKETANDVDQLKRNQLRESVHKWLSPPDPSTNHNIARGTHYKKTASWFFQGSIFQEWKSTGSLLWIHGKPGSGKSVICSTVIEDIEAMCKAGHALMTYFYFDFRDANKQRLRDLVASLLNQLSISSDPRCDILSDLYSSHDEGKSQPSDSILTECLKKMLTLPHQRPTYLIIDALDESPTTSGIPSSRERVLQLLKELVTLSLPNLHICVTSRPEIDIRNVLEPLTPRQVSLHDQSGQKKDIADYIRSIVYSDSEQIMRRWKKEDKELVIKTLSERADGMFRWAFCQLESLRHCFPPSVRHTLDELPESLDETYERVLKDIKKQNRGHARRLLQCLVVAIRPLRIEELAEVLAVDYDDAESMPKLKPEWRWEDHEQALLTSCSSLIAIVKAGDSRVVQFSHFSVKEFLTSARLATSSGDVSRYHIDLEPAHTILAQACLSILLESVDVGKSSPLAEYAAQYWVIHAQFKDVSSCLRKAIGYLFDPDKPYFAAWLQLHNIDERPNEGTSFYIFATRSEPDTSPLPLYYAALCGFQDLVEHLAIKYPQHVNASSGCYVTPLVAALARGHYQTAKYLYDNGAHLNISGNLQRNPLHSAAWYGDFEMVQVLLDYKADIDARSEDNWTSLHEASEGYGISSHHRLPDVVRLLLERGTDVNVLDEDNVTPLHVAARNGRVGVVHVLLEHGANVGAVDKGGRTPLHAAAEDRFNRRENDKAKVVSVLLEHGANVGAKDNKGRTPFQIASAQGYDEIVKLLSEHRGRAK